MEKRTLLAILLCVGIWIIWQQLFMDPMEPPAGAADGGAIAATDPAPAGQAGQVDGGTAPKTEGKTDDKALADSKPPTERPTEELVSIKDDRFEVILSSRGASLRHVKLADFKERVEGKKLSETGPEDLVSTEEELYLPMRLRMDGEKSSFKLPTYSDWRVEQAEAKRVRFRFEDPNNLEIPIITKTYELSREPYQIEMELEFINRSESSLKIQPILDMFAFFQAQVSTGCGGAQMAPRQPMCQAGE